MGSPSVLFCCVCLLVLGVSTVSALRVITTSGTRKEVARFVGNATKREIAIRLQRDDVQKGFLPFMNTTKGQELYQELLDAANQTFPEYLLEAWYLAEGAEVPFEHIFLLTIQSELSVFIHEHGAKLDLPYIPTLRTHCTDIISQPVEGLNSGIHGHNEDGGPGDKPINYLVNVTIFSEVNRSVVEERFIAYAYVGTLAGYAWGWNRHGLTVTENIILNLNQRYDAPPGALFGRALLAQRDIDSALELAMNRPGCAAGNVNLGEFTTGRTVSFEYDASNNSVGVKAVHHFAPQRRLAHSLPVSKYWYAHTNIYLVLKSASWPGKSSFARLATLGAYPPPNTTKDIRQMLGDTTNHDYPVYRNGSSPVDHGITCTTTLFNHKERSIHVYDENPKSSEPVLEFTWSPSM